MLWPYSIVLDGVEIPLSDVTADVQIHHGRTSVFDEPTATTCQLTVLDVEQAFVHDFAVGQELRVIARDGAATPVPRFLGRVTDAKLEVDDLLVIAAGRLSTLGQYPIGLVPWPVESWSARMRRLFAEAGLGPLLEFYPDPLFDPLLAARDPVTAGPTTLADYLNFLAPMLGAAVTDRPDGRIFVQAIGARLETAAMALDPADVAYVPVWEQVLPSGNIVTVRYTGDQSESVTIRDTTSIAMYGERPRTIDTSFVNAADATTRANTALARGAFARWNIPETPIVRGLELVIGQGVELSMMPAASPHDPWTPIVEGWNESISGDDWTMLVALSDPLLSGLGLPWNGVPTEWAWSELDPAAAWYDALTLEAITP